MRSMRHVKYQILAAALVALLALSLCALPGPWGGTREARAADPSAVPNLGNWTTDGYVTAIQSDGDTTYMGGTFNYVGPNTGFGVPLDTSTGLPPAVYPEVIGRIQVVIPDGGGGWYIGGGFFYVGGTAVNRLAHILPDGTLDSAFKPNVNNTVYALALSGDGSTLYIGGIFTSIQGTSGGPYNYANIAAINSDPASPNYGNPLPWTPGVNNGVMALTLTGDGNTLYVGGAFSSITGTSGGPYPRNCIAAIDTASANPTTWNPNVNNSVSALVLSGSTIYAAGSFTQIQGGSGGPYTRNYLAAIDTVNANPTSWNPGMSNTVPALALSADGKTLYAGGNFGTIQGASGGPYTRHYLAAIDADPASPGYGNPTAWNPDMNGSVYSLALHGSTLYAGGYFDTIQGASGGPYTRRYFAAIDAATANPTGLAAYANNVVLAIAASGDGSTVYVGGDLTSIGGVLRTNLAAIDAATGLPTDWSPAPDFGVNDLVLDGSIIYAGGAFSNIQGHSGGPYVRNYIAAIGVDPASPGYGNPTSFNPGADNTVFTLALTGDGNTLYAGGAFSSITGASGGPYPRNRIAAIDTAGANPTTWNPNVNNYVNSLVLSGSTLYAAGSFTQIQGSSSGPYLRNYLAAIDTVNANPTPWDPKPNNIVSDMALSGSILYVGGQFSTIQGGSGGPYLRNRLAAVDTATGNPNAFDPDADNNVLAVALSSDGSTLYAGGAFNRLKVSSGTPYTRNFIAAVDADPASAAYGDPTTWNPNMNNSVTDLEVSGSTLYAGGSFWVIGSRICTGFAAFDGAPTPGSINPRDRGERRVGERHRPGRGGLPGRGAGTVEEGRAGRYRGGQRDGGLGFQDHLRLRPGHGGRGGMGRCGHQPRRPDRHSGGRVHRHPGHPHHHRLRRGERRHHPLRRGAGGLRLGPGLRHHPGRRLARGRRARGRGERGGGDGIRPSMMSVADHTIAASFASDLSTWYLAEGSTDWGFDCYVSVVNPNDEAVEVEVTYMTSTGPVTGPTVDMPAMSQATVFPAATLGPRDFSTKVECTGGQAISVDRTMYWTGAGAPCSEAHCATGVTAPATTWYMPEGSSAWGFECFLLIQNPNASLHPGHRHLDDPGRLPADQRLLSPRQLPGHLQHGRLHRGGRRLHPGGPRTSLSSRSGPCTGTRRREGHDSGGTTTAAARLLSGGRVYRLRLHHLGAGAEPQRQPHRCRPSPTRPPPARWPVLPSPCPPTRG